MPLRAPQGNYAPQARLFLPICALGGAGRVRMSDAASTRKHNLKPGDVIRDVDGRLVFIRRYRHKGPDGIVTWYDFQAEAVMISVPGRDLARYFGGPNNVR